MKRSTIDVVPEPAPMLVGHGLYDIAEVGRLVGVTVDTVSRWVSSTKKRGPLLEPELDPFFSFHDLLTVQLIRELRTRKVPLTEIATGLVFLQDVLGVARPFAHEGFATSGRAWLAEFGGQQVDVGRGGQLAWDEAVAPTLRRLDYAGDGMATIWRPVDRIWLNRDVQAGASCIDESRTTTRFVHDLLEAGTDIHDIEWQFEIELEDLIAARDFEMGLDKRRPLQLTGD